MTESEKKPTVWQVIASVLAAMFGVQSSKARARDFQRGNPVLFILVGLAMVVVFVLFVVMLVKIVLSFAPVQ